MIPIVEIKETARAFGVPPSTIERDYAKNWLLAHLSALPMALKGGTGIRKVFIDLTTMSNESVLLPVEKRLIYHPYSDRLTAGVTSYCLEEIMAEKIRSLFQRIRPRDIYDIRHLADRVNPDVVRGILHRKCACKGVVPDNFLLAGKRERFSASWNASLRHQMKAVPDFEEAFERALDCVELYTQRPGEVPQGRCDDRSA